VDDLPRARACARATSAMSVRSIRANKRSRRETQAREEGERRERTISLDDEDGVCYEQQQQLDQFAAPLRPPASAK
jgi:hypothetical protein